MLHRDFRSVRVMALVAAVAMLAFSAPCFAAGGMSEEDVPETSGVPAEGPSGSARAPEIEPAQARLKVLQDAPVYSAPAKTSKHIEQLTTGKFVEVTGSTHYYLQVQLKSGQTGYIDPSAVEVVKPTDKVFVLTHDAGVLDKPNRWAKKLAEVHQSHNVHVIGIALNYVQIRMKSGLEGFVPLTA